MPETDGLLGKLQEYNQKLGEYEHKLGLQQKDLFAIRVRQYNSLKLKGTAADRKDFLKALEESINLLEQLSLFDEYLHAPQPHSALVEHLQKLHQSELIIGPCIDKKHNTTYKKFAAILLSEKTIKASRNDDDSDASKKSDISLLSSTLEHSRIKSLGSNDEILTSCKVLTRNVNSMKNRANPGWRPIIGLTCSFLGLGYSAASFAVLGSPLALSLTLIALTFAGLGVSFPISIKKELMFNALVKELTTVTTLAEQKIREAAEIAKRQMEPGGDEAKASPGRPAPSPGRTGD